MLNGKQHATQLQREEERSSKTDSYLFGFFLDAVQDSPKGRFGKATLQARFLVALKACTHALRTIVKSIAKRLMDRL